LGSDKKERLFLLAAVAAAFLIRLAWILSLDNTVNVWDDWWDQLALNLISGKGYAVANPIAFTSGLFYSWRPPAFPLFLSVPFFFFGRNYLAAKISVALISSVSAVLVYYTGKRFFGRPAGTLACAATALYPTFIFFSGYLAPESLTLFLILSFLFFLARDTEKPSVSNYAFCGLFLGLAVLCRTILSLFFVFILAWMLLNYRGKKEIAVKFAVMVLVMAAVVSPWIIRNYRIHHAFLLNSTDSGQALYINNNPDSFKDDPSGVAYYYKPEEFSNMGELETNRTLAGRAIEFIKKNPVTYIKYVGRRLLNFWRPFPHRISGPGQPYSAMHVAASAAYTIPLFALALAGFFMSLKNWKKLSLLYFFMIYYCGTHVLVRATIRYRMPVEPYLILFASYGLWMLWTKLKDKPKT